ncbi:GumC family protein [Flexithrix dorotheae]|uniref:GumC family protein n=1 Tax=Flexithrix dorotheae TaxID=70993 RepID=UPI0003637E8E|nr:polysaccharide biosynthesis tyrosine autokinase [Flexithrix dorotheae]
MDNQDTVFIDVKKIFFRILSKWYYFVGTLVIAGLLAFVYNKTAEKIYSFKASMLIGQGQAVNRSVGQILTAMGANNTNKGPNLKDEMGKLTSFSMLRTTFEKLDMKVSYYMDEKPGKNEQYGPGSFPFTVLLDSLDPQPLNTPIFITIISAETYKIDVNAENVAIYNYETNEIVTRLPSLVISEELNFGEAYKSDHLTFRLIPDNEFKGELVAEQPLHFMFNNFDDLADRYVGKLEVSERDRDSYILDIESKGANPKKEIAIMNTLMEVYADKDLEEKRKQSKEALDYIEEQLYTAKYNLYVSETKESNYKASTSMPNTEFLTAQLTGSLATLRKERDELEGELRLYQQLNDYLNSSTTVSSATSTFGINDPVVISLINDLATLGQQRLVAVQSLGERSPQVKTLDVQINATKEQLKGHISSSIQAKVISKRDLDNRIIRDESQISLIPTKARQIDELERSSEFNKATFQNLQQKKTEAEILLTTTTSDVKIIDAARMKGSTPISPRPMLSYLIAIVVGLLIPYVFITMKDYLDDNVKTKEDLISSTKIPYLGMILKGEKSTSLVFEGKSKSAVAESFRSLRVNIEHMRNANLSRNGMSSNGKHTTKVIGLTSSVSGEGKTYCSVNLSSAFAQSGKKTVLICGDLRKPKFIEYFNLNAKKGLADYLVGDSEIEEILQPTKIDNLMVIDAGFSPNNPNPTIILDSVRMDQLIEKLKANFDQILIDTPPIGFVSEYFILRKYIDSSIYIVRSNYTNKKLLGEINDLYDSRKITEISVVLNDVKLSSSMYGYSDGKNGYSYS